MLNRQHASWDPKSPATGFGDGWRHRWQMEIAQGITRSLNFWRFFLPSHLLFIFFVQRRGAARNKVWGAVGNPRAEGSDFALLTLGQE